MTKGSLERFKKALEDHLASVVESIAPLKEVFAINTDDRMDEIDYANAKIQQHLALRLHERSGKFSEKVNALTQRIYDGTFGVCRECGEGIDPARLEARPMTVFCVKCKETIEKEERRRKTPRTLNLGHLGLIGEFG